MAYNMLPLSSLIIYKYSVVPKTWQFTIDSNSINGKIGKQNQGGNICS